MSDTSTEAVKALIARALRAEAERDEARAEVERRPEPAFRDALISDRNKAEAERDALAVKLDAVRALRDHLAKCGFLRVEESTQTIRRKLDAILADTDEGSE